MRDIAILNLTRFGDLIQTTPVLKGLRKRYPDARLHLIIKHRFRAVPELLPELDQVHEIDGDHLAEVLSDPNYSFLERFKAVREIIRGLQQTRFDFVVNFTHSRSSAALLSLMNAEEMVGFQTDRIGQRIIEDPWLSHMSTLVKTRRLSRINLVDIYLGGAGIPGQGGPLEVRIPNSARAFAKDRVPENGTRVAVQLAGSTNNRSWTVDHYARTLRRLNQLLPDLQIVLVGVDSERSAAEELVSQCSDLSFTDLVGATRIDELAGVLERVDLLLTGDTGTMHLAAATGTTTFAVFVGLASPHETCAYAPDQWIVSTRISCWPCSHNVHCGNTICHEDIPPEWLAQVLARVIQKLDVDDLDVPPQADLFRTRFDDNGFLEAVPLFRRKPDAQELLALVFRAAFIESFGGVTADPSLIRKIAAERYQMGSSNWLECIPHELPAEVERMRHLGEGAQQNAAELLRLANRPTELSRIAAALQQTDEEIYKISRAQPLLSPIGHSLESGLENLPDEELAIVAKTSIERYRELYRRASILSDVIHGRNAEKSEIGAFR